MQRTYRKRKIWRILWAGAAAVLVWSVRGLVWQAACYLFWGGITALAALPVMKRLERKLSAGAAAMLSIAVLNAVLGAALFLLLPAMIRQFRQLAELVPEMWQGAENISGRFQAWLAGRGVDGVKIELHTALLSRMQDVFGAAVPALIEGLRGMAGGIGQWLFAPVFGFYFLRDRHVISAWFASVLPSGWREPAVRMLREMQRDTAGYLRGQLLVSAVVGALTAAGLLVLRVPHWFALGIWMGVLELIPYVGPLAGGAVITLFALPLGLWRAVWALAVVLLVQQLEGWVIGPKLISQTTRLHPAAVILCILLGGSAAGVAGVLLSVPLVLCLRAALRTVLFGAPRQ